MENITSPGNPCEDGEQAPDSTTSVRHPGNKSKPAASTAITQLSEYEFAELDARNSIFRTDGNSRDVPRCQEVGTGEGWGWAEKLGTEVVQNVPWCFPLLREEGRPRRSSKCNATSDSAWPGRSKPCCNETYNLPPLRPV
jgi:hypothetical protein